MVRFLSDEWLGALDAAAAALVIDATITLCVEHVVDDVIYHVTYADGRVRVHGGVADNPTVRFRSDHATAAAIARGELSAQRSFMQGTLRIEGDTLTLTAAQASLRNLDDVFAEVRAGTEW